MAEPALVVPPAPKISYEGEASAKAYVHVPLPDNVNYAKHSYYKTPGRAVERFLSAQGLVGPVWDPACGDGAISRGLVRFGYEVHSTDLVDRGYGQGGRNFFLYRPRFKFRCVCTNPPFRLGGKMDGALMFVQRALSVGAEQVCIVARLGWLEGKNRKEFFENSCLARVWVYSGRVNISRNGEDFGDEGEGGMVAYAWYVWERGHEGPPTIGWI